MTIGVRQAKTELTKLINAAMEGETIVITNHGKPLVRLVPEGRTPSKNRGYGCLKGAFEIPEDWDKTDAEVEGLFEHIQALKKPGRIYRRSMSLLLDTNVVLRWLRGDILHKRIVTRIEKADRLFVSMITPWEISLKASRHPSQKMITSAQLSSGLAQMGAVLLHIQREHIDRLATLPDHHHDPFDRMIIAQSIEEKYTCVSSDERFPLYEPSGLDLLWK